MKERWQPSLRTAPAYYDDPGYIEALARSVESHLGGLDWEPEVLLASFHGVPRENLDKGDPYHCQCQKTARLLRERLGWPEERLRIVFQSRFGPKEWLQPYADETVMALAKQGTKRIAMISPGFVADCLETLEELDMDLREDFLAAGGEAFAYVPCLNDSPAQIEFLAASCLRELSGWINPARSEENP
jgi:ferrochelatase